MDSDERLIEAWKTTIEVQRHFNEIEMRIRNVAITVLAAFLAAAGYTTKENLLIEVFGITVSLTTCVLMAAAICWMSFYRIDKHYHRLLRGAVRHGESIEDSAPPEFGLTKAISDASRREIPARKLGPIKLPRLKLGSGTRIGAFYYTIFGILVVAAILSLVDEKHLNRVTGLHNERSAVVPASETSTKVSDAPPTGAPTPR